MKTSPIPQPLTPSQIELVLELLELRQLAPIETAARFERLAQSGTFSEPQQEAIEILFSMEEHEIPDALFECVDDEARELVRGELTHEVQLRYV